MGDFQTNISLSALRQGKTEIFSAIKSFEGSRMLRFGWPKDILSKGQKTTKKKVKGLKLILLNRFQKSSSIK